MSNKKDIKDIHKCLIDGKYFFCNCICFDFNCQSRLRTFLRPECHGTFYRKNTVICLYNKFYQATSRDVEIYFQP